MPFLGVTPTDKFASLEKQTIIGNGGSTYTLNNPVSSPTDIALFINNVRQEPTVAYTITSGTTLSLTGNITSGDNCYLIYIARTFQSRSTDATTKGVFYENNQTLYENVTIDINKNAMVTGPITIADGVTFTIRTGSRVVIL